MNNKQPLQASGLRADGETTTTDRILELELPEVDVADEHGTIEPSEQDARDDVRRRVIRVAAATPEVRPGDVSHNVDRLLALIREAVEEAVDLIVFPELALTGKTCGDLFDHRMVRDEALTGLARLAYETRTLDMLILVSLPLALEDRLIKATAMLFRGDIVGMTPAAHLSRADRRHFSPADSCDTLTHEAYELFAKNEPESQPHGEDEPYGLTFKSLSLPFDSCPIITKRGTVGADLSGDSVLPCHHCVLSEDDVAFTCDLERSAFLPEQLLRYAFHFVHLCTVIPCLTVMPDLPAPSLPGRHAPEDLFAGALPAAADDMRPALAKGSVPLLAISDARPDYPLQYDAIRRELLRRSENEQCVIVYAGAGKGESTADHLYAGHRLICCDGAILAEAEPFTTGLLIAEMASADLFSMREKTPLMDIRTLTPSADCGPSVVNAEPFLPCDRAERRAYCLQALELQARGLADRLGRLDARPVLGLSGGIDSALALLVALKACVLLDKPAETLLVVSMPGPGTSDRSRELTEALARAAGADFRTIDISDAVAGHLADLGHDGIRPDVVFENAQARERTQILMDLANLNGGIVVGTGDLSELALGFCTYNGDQMSMYSVNHTIPKTVAKRMLAVCADELTRHGTALFGEGADVCGDLDPDTLAHSLRAILARPISPELLPPDDEGRIAQKTEDLLGPYELNDFYLYHLIFRRESPRRVLELADEAFGPRFGAARRREVLRSFIRRFFASQFKRRPSPEGISALPFSLTSETGFDMPGDLSPRAMLAALDE